MTDHLYNLPDAPFISGLHFRPVAGASDAASLLAVRLGCAEQDGFDRLSTTESLPSREELVQSLTAITESAGEDRTIVAEIHGRAVGYNRIFDWTERDGTNVWLTVGWVLPEWRNLGLGTTLLHWTERRIRELAAAQPGRWEFAANASSTEAEATTLLRDNDYTAAYTVLEMGLDWNVFTPKTGLPDGMIARPGLVEHAEAIAASVAESYAGEYGSGRYSEAFDPAEYATELAGSSYDPLLWRVAWAGSEVVGQVIPLIEKGRAEIYEVSVRPAWRRDGVARALLSLALLELQTRGVEVVRLHTVAEFRTRAVDLYESLGFRVLKEFPRYRKQTWVE